MPSRGIAARLLSGLITLSLAVCAPFTLASPAAAQAPPAQALRIAVLDGEDAVNIIQQRTAVAPVVQVTDRNGQPVAGATVRFAIRAGKATFRGARTLTVTTDTAGRAVAMGLSPTGAGAVEIGATATFQGQAAVATITQTNVMTAAQAAAAAGAGAGSGGAATATGAGASTAGTAGAAAGTAAAGGAVAAGGAAAGAGTAAAGAAAGAAAAGGGIGLTTVAIAGAAVAGGTYAATKVVGGGGGDQPQLKGTFTGQMIVSYVVKATGAAGCARTNALSGTFTFDYRESNGSIEGEFDDETDWRVVANTCSDGVGATLHSGYQLKVSGTPSSITGSGQRTGINGTATVTDSFQFTGSLAGGTLTGTYTMSSRIDLPQEVGTGSAAIPATLR